MTNQEYIDAAKVVMVRRGIHGALTAHDIRAILKDKEANETPEHAGAARAMHIIRTT